MVTCDLYITYRDRMRLIELVRREARQRPRLDEFDKRLRWALPCESDALPPDVVTMNSLFQLRDLHTDAVQTIRLVYPRRGRTEAASVSVLSPLGMAAIGRRVGDTIWWMEQSTVRSGRIEDVLFQPRAAHADHL